MTTTRKTTPQATQDQEAAALAAAEANTQAQAELEAQAALAQAQDEVLATVHPINGQQDPQEGQEAQPQAEAGPQPSRATWRQHGNPLSGWQFFLTSVKAPNPKGIKVVKVVVDPQGVTLRTSAGRAIDGGPFCSATKFWALVPADATLKVEEPKAPRTVAGLWLRAGPQQPTGWLLP